MRHLVKLAVALLLGAFGASAHAHIEFVPARLVSLERANDRWVLKLEIQRPQPDGSTKVAPQLVTIQIGREPRCIVTKDLYLGTPEEFEEALDVVRAQIATGGVHRFGLNARAVTDRRDEFLAVDLRVTRAHPQTGEQVVWTIQPETGLDLCPLKYEANR